MQTSRECAQVLRKHDSTANEVAFVGIREANWSTRGITSVPVLTSSSTSGGRASERTSVAIEEQTGFLQVLQ